MPQREKGYRGTSLKSELVGDIEQFIREHPEAGYKSVADFVSEAVRLRIQNLKGKYPA